MFSLFFFIIFVVGRRRRRRSSSSSSSSSVVGRLPISSTHRARKTSNYWRSSIESSATVVASSYVITKSITINQSLLFIFQKNNNITLFNKLNFLSFTNVLLLLHYYSLQLLLNIIISVLFVQERSSARRAVIESTRSRLCLASWRQIAS